METTITRRCSKCGRDLPVTEFYKYTKRPGYTAWCRDCYKKRNADKDVKQRHKEADAIRALKMANEIEFGSKVQKTEQPVKEVTQIQKPSYEELSIHELIKLVKKHKDFNLKEFFTPRELINALYDLGYRGELSIMVEHKIKLSHE